MKISNILILLAALTVSPVNAHKDHAADHSSPLSTMAKPQGLGSASMKLLEREIELTDGYGKGMFFQSPTNDEQKYVNQGYAALNVFHYADAYRSFRMATELNSNSVQGYVGLVFSIADQDSSPEAQQLVINIFNHLEMVNNMMPFSAKEKAWIDYAKAIYFDKMGGTTNGLTNPTKVSLNSAFSNLRNIDGENIEFKVYVSWTIVSGNTINYIKQIAASVLNDHPNHAGAAHYLLHIAEMENDMTTARAYGEILTPLALGSAHAQHMLGHTLPQFGLWQEALDMFLIADQIHHDWATKNEAELQEDWHYAHNLDLMAAAYLGLGDDRKAFDVWAMAMPYDFRAVPKAIGVLLATNRLAEADSLLTSLEQNGPQWVNFLSSFRYELNILTNPNTPQKKFIPQNGSYEYLVEAVRNFGKNKVNENGLILNAKSYFTQRLTSGGFDGWSNSFVELLRLKNLAKTVNAPTIEAELQKIVDASRQGTL